MNKINRLIYRCWENVVFGHNANVYVRIITTEVYIIFDVAPTSEQPSISTSSIGLYINVETTLYFVCSTSRPPINLFRRWFDVSVSAGLGTTLGDHIWWFQIWGLHLGTTFGVPHLGTKLGGGGFWGTILEDQILGGPNFRGTKFLGDQMFGGPNFSGTKFLGDQIWGQRGNVLWDQIFVGQIWGDQIGVGQFWETKIWGDQTLGGGDQIFGDLSWGAYFGGPIFRDLWLPCF